MELSDQLGLESKVVTHPYLLSQSYDTLMQ
jgi:hypothetical protein